MSKKLSVEIVEALVQVSSTVGQLKVAQVAIDAAHEMEVEAYKEEIKALGSENGMLKDQVKDLAWRKDALFESATERLHTRQSEQQQEITNNQAADQLQAELRSNDFNPKVNPLATSSAPFTIDHSPFTIQNSSLTSCPNPTPGDTDCDGNTDDDGDGLTDEVEVVKLGTNPNLIDTDGDRISDKVEVTGFNLNGRYTSQRKRR